MPDYAQPDAEHRTLIGKRVTRVDSRKRRATSSAIILVLLFSQLCAAQNGKVESIEALTDTSVSKGVREALESKGYRVLLDDGTPVCELWIGKTSSGTSRYAKLPTGDVNYVIGGWAADWATNGVSKFQKTSEKKDGGAPKK